jgi:hypothetical protein
VNEATSIQTSRTCQHRGHETKLVVQTASSGEETWIRSRLFKTHGVGKVRATNCGGFDGNLDSADAGRGHLTRIFSVGLIAPVIDVIC